MTLRSPATRRAAPVQHSLRDAAHVTLLKNLLSVSAHLSGGDIAGGNEAILREGLRLLDEVITKTPEGGPVERRTFCVPRLNSASAARITFDLDRVVEQLLASAVPDRGR